MKRKQTAWLRAIGVVLAVIVIVSGVTFAALQSQQDTLTGNTIETATANLQLSIDGTSYGDTRTGFDFNNIIPGGPAVPTAGYSFYLKNAGGTSLSLKLAVISQPTNLSGVDLTKVNVLLTTVGSGTAAQSFALQSLIDGADSGGLAITSGILASGVAQQYRLQVSMAADAVTGSSASLGNIDFALSGQTVSN
jgi:hypothetical protein